MSILVATLLGVNSTRGGTFALMLPSDSPDPDWVDDNLRTRAPELTSCGILRGERFTLSLNELRGCECNIAYSAFHVPTPLTADELARFIGRELLVLAGQLRQPGTPIAGRATQ